MRALLLLAWPLLAWSLPLPDKPHPQVEFGGFQPVHPGRGAGPSSGFHGPSTPPLQPHPNPDYSPPSPQHSVPTKTIYVNLPPQGAPPPLPPVAAGPPRKHFKIVLIRAPAPPPQVQTILPPRTEHKTKIYVLHQRPQDEPPQVVEVPHVPHDPQVYFVEYDTPPTAHDLQQLSSGNLNGFTVTPQHPDSGEYGPPSSVHGLRGDLGVGAGLQVAGDGLYQSNIFKRQVEEEAAEAAEDGEEAQPLHT
ncbi:uncharacterized protein LOC135113711 [Scylla paramamosain]